MRFLVPVLVVLALGSLGAVVAVLLTLDRKYMIKRAQAIAASMGGQVVTLAPTDERRAAVGRPDLLVTWTRGGIEYRLFLERNRVELHALARNVAMSPLQIGERIVLGERGVRGPKKEEGPLVGLPKEANPLKHLSVQEARTDGRARAFLNERVARNLDLLDRLEYSRGVGVEVTDGVVMVTKSASFDDLDSLRFFLNLAEPVIARALEVCVVQGIEYVPQTKAQRGACPVCGSELPADPVLCPKCRTPHHAECWKWAGKCATYGCGGGPAEV